MQAAPHHLPTGNYKDAWTTHNFLPSIHLVGCRFSSPQCSCRCWFCSPQRTGRSNTQSLTSKTDSCSQHTAVHVHRLQGLPGFQARSAAGLHAFRNSGLTPPHRGALAARVARFAGATRTPRPIRCVCLAVRYGAVGQGGAR